MSTETTRRYDRVISIALIVGAVLFAVLAQSLFFEFSNSIKGDHSYHRGVAATIMGGNWEGGGPLPGTLSYYGGFLPMGMALGERILDVSYDGLLSVVSWIATLAWPIALFVLGRRIWRTDPLKQGFLVFVGTVGSSLALDSRSEWVLSILPSGSNMWPLYPRDIALVSMVFALAVAMGAPTLRRAVGAGLVLGVALASQFQVGLFATAIVTVWNLVATGYVDRRDRLKVTGLTVAVGFLVTSWYWIPRVYAAIEYRPVLLQSYPGADPPNFSAAGLVNALGFVGLLAVFGVVAVLREQRRARTEEFFLGWLVLFIPFFVIGASIGDVGVITPRRFGLFISLPIVVLAAKGAAWIMRVKFGPVLVGLVIVGIVTASLTEVVHTRERVDKLWSDDALGYEAFRHALWDDVDAKLTSDVKSGGPVRVLAPDNDAAFVWSETGAQPFSLWLQGVIKLGFDPGAATGIGYLERVRETQHAFSGGRSSLCALARRRDLDVAVLRTADGLVAYHDVRPSARWRVSPQERSTSTLSRKVGKGIEYKDRNVFEQVWLSRGARLPVGFSGKGVRMVDVEAIGGGAGAVPSLILKDPAGSTIVPTVTRNGRTTTYRFRTPNGVAPGSRIMSRRLTMVSRILGYEEPHLPSLRIPTGSVPRPIVIPTATLCRASGLRSS